MDFAVGIRVTSQQISNLLTLAFTGGSNYWCAVEQCIEPTSWQFNSIPNDILAQDYPLNPGGALLISDSDIIDAHNKIQVFRLNRQAIQKGIQAMAEKYPTHFADVLTDKSSTDTGDVFLQCCVYGEVIHH